jgi:hypothetical protein
LRLVEIVPNRVPFYPRLMTLEMRSERRWKAFVAGGRADTIPIVPAQGGTTWLMALVREDRPYFTLKVMLYFGLAPVTLSAWSVFTVS